MKNFPTFSTVTATRRGSALFLVALATAACASSGGKNTSGDESTTGPSVGDTETVGDKPGNSSTTEMLDPTTGTDTDPTFPDSCSSGCGYELVCTVETDVLPDELPCEAGKHCEAYEDECGCLVRNCVPDCDPASCPEGEVCDAGSGKCVEDECSSGCGDVIECQPEGSGDSTGGEPFCEPGFHCSVDVSCGCTVALCQPDCDPTDPTSCPAGKVCNEETKSCES